MLPVMSEYTSQAGGLEARIVPAVEFARADAERWRITSEAETDAGQQLVASIHLAAYAAVRAVLEEVLEPGAHSAEEPSQPPAG